MDTDAATVDRVTRGDPDAFRLLVERHSRSVYRLAYRLTRNEQDADDVVQETFLRAYRHLESFDARSSFSTWLHRIATNSAFDLLRRNERHKSEEIDDDLPTTAVAAELEPAMRIGVRTAVANGMKQLTGNERTAFILRHFEGMSLEEIGQILGTETNATKNTIFRAVKKLRQFLEPLVKTT